MMTVIIATRNRNSIFVALIDFSLLPECTILPGGDYAARQARVLVHWFAALI
jgi:hypothetical protein